MDFVLLLLGEGQGMEGIRKLSEELQIGDKVIFAGNRTNVSDYYQAMDYVVYPSRYEGLPGSIVEAQCAGLKCLMSDRICQEVIATELVTTMDIDKDPASWAAYLAGQLYYDRTDHAGQMRDAGFDVTCQAEKMMKFYETGKWV